MESDLLGVYTCEALLANKLIISNDFQLLNEIKSYFYIKIFVDVLYSEVATEFVGLVLVSFDELLKQDPSDDEYSSALCTRITSLYGRLIYSPHLWHYINNSVYKVASNVVWDPQNSGHEIVPMIVSLSFKNFMGEDPDEEEDSEEEEIEGDLEEEYTDTDLDWTGPKKKLASKGLMAALDTISIRDQGDMCVISYEQFGIGSIATHTYAMYACLSWRLYIGVTSDRLRINLFGDQN